MLEHYSLGPLFGLELRNFENLIYSLAKALWKKEFWHDLRDRLVYKFLLNLQIPSLETL